MTARISRLLVDRTTPARSAGARLRIPISPPPETTNELMNSRIVPPMTALAIAAALLIHTVASTPTASGQDSDAAMAAYADAANFQTGGAIRLAIQSWTAFVEKYPDHPMVSQALHYLGVCHMQSETPDYDAASKAFGKALQNKDYQLREESLANRGWCLYSAATADPEKKLSPRDARKLKLAIENFKTLRDEFPESRFLDRALFYSGEAASGLGQAKQAIRLYNGLLSMPSVKDSPLRCDALYARGVAYEGIESYEDAIVSYRQLIDQCRESELATDVHLRLGDIQIRRNKFDAAIKDLQQAYESASQDEEKSYALFRQAYAHVQADRPDQAADKYEQLLEEFPDSQYTATARLASAQSTYRSGKIDQAAKRFKRVLESDDLASATEAAHWLARIEISRSRFDRAAELIRRQIERGAEGKFATELRLDLAEVLSMDPRTADQAMKMFEEVYRQDTSAAIAARALYNAAFSAIQTGQHPQALKLANEFLDRFPKNSLRPDIQFIAAESLLIDRQPKAAADQYTKLVASTPADHPQRAAWLLRTAIALNASQRYDETIELIGGEINSFTSPEQSAEAYQLLGRAKISQADNQGAIEALRASLKAADWKGTHQTLLMLGQAYAAVGDNKNSVATWNELVRNNPNTTAADQARYRIAQFESNRRRFDRALELFQQVIDSPNSDQIVPHALYGKAWALMQQGNYQPAIATLSALIDRFADHALYAESVLARGICYRNLAEYGLAKRDLDAYLTTTPTGTSLGHALYELALIDQKDQAPDRAARKLKQLVSEVPDYPAMDKVLYELGWSLQESGDPKQAAIHFASLIEQFPDADLAADAAYYIGQNHYAAKAWDQAAQQFQFASRSQDAILSEKSLYRLGWSRYQLKDYAAAEAAFSQQSERHPDGKLAFDATAMVGECRFKLGRFEAALAAFEQTRRRMRENDETSANVRDEASRRVRELALLHGGQSAAQLEQWDAAIDWHAEHRQRFPASNYLPQVFYETGFAYHQQGDTDSAIKFYSQVADKYRNEVGARARFMIGEIYFGKQALDKAIPEFQRVMFGYGADQAPPEIKNWQAKSGFEAGRCSEALMQAAKTPNSKAKAREFCQTFYSYLVNKHPEHEVTAEARKRLEELSE